MAIQLKPQGNWELVPIRTRATGGEYIVVTKSGSFRLSRDAYEGLLGSPERIASYMDREAGVVGFAPTSTGGAKPTASLEFSARVAVRILGIRPGYYALRPINGLIGFSPTEDRMERE